MASTCGCIHQGRLPVPSVSSDKRCSGLPIRVLNPLNSLKPKLFAKEEKCIDCAAGYPVNPSWIRQADEVFTRRRQRFSTRSCLKGCRTSTLTPYQRIDPAQFSKTTLWLSLIQSCGNPIDLGGIPKRQSATQCLPAAAGTRW